MRLTPVVAGFTVAALVCTAAAAGAPRSARPDLRVWGVIDPPSQLAVGQEFSEAITVRNVGAVKTTAEGRTKIYLTHDPQHPTPDISLGSVTLPRLRAGHESTKGIRLKLPANTPIDAKFGESFVLVCTDTTNRVRESNEHNNCVTSAIPMRVLPPSA